MYKTFVKRLLDILLSLLALIPLSPVFLVLWIRVRQELGRPALFRQERPGKDGRIFTMYKFRSMTDETDANGTPLPDAERLPPFGAMLRRTSLDELPELFNVLRGEMSLIGPRPLLVRYLPLYSAEQARRHEVKPGLTGWAQVHGRNALRWEDKFRHDVWYADHLSAGLDLRIFIKTVRAVLKREGVSQDGQATMEEFTGK
ncbi:MAG: sugar transferase [Clostridiales Family XIII bacterium]|jgi:lipopolysaccharide/colanic/teichoic acid biosynthesis glycosyltransferase|nr:sugar transferase [Clostridiales Family XIII bacterium]